MEFIEIILEDSQYKLLNKTILDKLCLDYFLSFPNDPKLTGEDKVILLEHPSLRGYGLRFHEKWEIREFLRFGLDNKRILTPEYREKINNPDFPHNSAIYYEHLFYQRIGKVFLDKNIPILALRVVRQNFDFQGVDNLDSIFNDFGYFYRRIKNKNFSGKDICNAIELFEKTGWKFENASGIFEYFDELKKEIGILGLKADS